MAVAITSVTPAATRYALDAETGIVIAGTGFGASQGSGSVTWEGQSQTVTAWSDTSITITANLGAASAGRGDFTVTNDALESDTYRMPVLSAAPTLKIAATRFAANTSSGNQNVTTTALGGVTPKAVLFLWNGATAEGLNVGDVQWGMGSAVSSTARACVTGYSQDNAATTVEQRRGAIDECIMFVDSAGAVDGEADFVTFITNGCTINWGNPPTNGALITAVFFSDTEGAAFACGMFAPAGDPTVTTLGDDPDVLICFGNGVDIDDLPDAVSELDVGFASFVGVEAPGAGTVTQRYHGDHSQGGQGAAAKNAIWRNNAVCGQPFPSNAWAASVAPNVGSGFDITTDTGSPGTDQVGYLAMKLPGVGVQVFDYDTPTATGDASKSGVGFKPQAVLMAGGLLVSADQGSVQSDGDASVFHVGAFTEDGDEYSHGRFHEDAADPTNCGDALENRAVYQAATDGSGVDLAADFSSFDSDGFTLNYTNANGTSRRWAGLAFESFASGGVEGALSATLDGATLEAAGSVQVQGSVAETLDDAVVSAAGVVRVKGTTSAALEGATLAADAASVVDGTLSAQTDDATLTSAAAAPVAASSSQTLEDATVSALASGPGASGQLAQTLEDMSLAAAAGEATAAPAIMTAVPSIVPKLSAHATVVRKLDAAASVVPKLSANPRIGPQ